MTPPEFIVDLTSVSPTTGGGIGRVATGVVDGLARSGADLRCLVGSGTLLEWVAALPETKIDEVAVRMSAGSAWQVRLRSILPPSLKTSRLVGAVRRIRSAAVRSEAGNNVVWYPFHRSLATATNSVVTVHDLRVFEPQLASVMDQRIIAQNVQSAKAIVCSWPHPYESLLERFPEAREKAFQIPLPVLNAGPPRERRKTPTGDVTLLYPAYITEHKNHETLIRALPLLPGARLILTGVENEHGRFVRMLAEQLGVASRIEWRGYVDEDHLDKAYDEADILVMPSLWEAASGPVLEAVIRRIPFVSSDIAPLTAQVRHLGLPVRDWTFRARDERALADAVTATMASYEERVMALEGPANIVGQRTWDSTASDYHRVFAWVAGVGEQPTDLQPEATVR
ncbi:glycosyltransferase family 4 protein [Humibacter ginsengisoli]